MILVIGLCADKVVGQFIQYCVKTSMDFAFVDIKQLGHQVNLQESHWLFSDYGSIAHHQISGVYNRFLDWPKGDKTTMQQCEQLYDWLDHRYPNVINRPKDTMSNLSKPYQLEIASQFKGWEIPKTNIMINTQVEIKKPYICKSISSERSIVNKVYCHTKKNFFEPAILQEYLPGLNIRVHVCGDKVIAVGVRSDAVDYRYSRFENDIFMYHLPGYIEKDCIALNHVLGLKFSGIDLIYYQNKYYFLEANPSPGYAYFEQALSMPYISSVLAKCLMETCH